MFPFRFDFAAMSAIVSSPFTEDKGKKVKLQQQERNDAGIHDD